MNRKFLIANVFCLSVLGTMGLIQSCKKDDQTNMSPNDPRIESFAPAGAAKDSLVVINGANFNPNTLENTVTFNGIEAVITAATATTLTVRVPAHARNGK